MIIMEEDFGKKKRLIKTDIINGLISLIGIIIVIIQMIEIKYDIGENNIRLYMYSIIIFFVIITMNILGLINSRKEIQNEISIKKLEEKSKNLLEVSDDVRCFKHDFLNIMQAINGYIDVNDMEALRKYFNSLMKECHHINTMDVLNYRVLDNPAMYAVLLNKYKFSKENNINMSIEILSDLGIFGDKTYKVSRILGILLDNAIEASLDSEERNVNVQFIKRMKENKTSIIIENTYKNEDINLEKIFEKNYSTKKAKGNSGLGLWKIKNIIQNDTNLNLKTTKDENIFKQELEFFE